MIAQAENEGKLGCPQRNEAPLSGGGECTRRRQDVLTDSGATRVSYQGPEAICSVMVETGYARP